MKSGQQQACVAFKQVYKAFNSFPLEPEVGQSQAYQKYVEHMHNCAACSDWYMAQVVRSRGYDPETFACVHVAYHGTLDCKVHDDPFDCPDVLILYNQADHTYALPVRDFGPGGICGGSFVLIAYCPWCGVALRNAVAPGIQRINI